MEGGTSDTATKKSSSNDSSEVTKGAVGKDDKEEPMEVDAAAEKDDKSKSASKTSENSGSGTSVADSKSSTKEPPSVTASS